MSLAIDKYTASVFHFDGTDGATADTSDAEWYPNEGQTAITFHGSAQLDTAEKKFGVSSCLFNGTTDYLEIGDIDLGRFLHGNSDRAEGSQFRFTVDFWIKKPSTGLTGNQSFLSTFPSSRTSSAIGFNILMRDTHAIQAAIADGSGTIYFNLVTASNVIPDDTDWHHIAFTFDDTLGSNEGKIFVDGTLVAQGNVTGSTPSGSSSSKIIVGRQNDGTEYFDGWMDEIRLQNSVKWSASFTPPTAPYNNLINNNTVFLTDLESTDGATAIDDESPNKFDISFNGAAQIDTAESLINDSSLLLNGTTDYLEVGTHLYDWDWLIGNLETNDLRITVDFYFKKASTGLTGNQTLFTTQSSRSSSNDGISIWLSDDHKIRAFIADDSAAANVLGVDNSVPDDTEWHHAAITFDPSLGSGHLKIYIDGQKVAEGDKDHTPGGGFSTSLLRIGAAGNDTEFFDGWIDRPRISSSILWTSNFVPEGITPPVSNTGFVHDKKGGRLRYLKNLGNLQLDLYNGVVLDKSKKVGS